MKLFDDEWEEKKIWEVRESGLGATAFVAGMKDTWPGWEDSAVPPDKVGPISARPAAVSFTSMTMKPSLYGHFGQGCIHCRIAVRSLTPRKASTNTGAFLDEASDLVLSLRRFAFGRTWRWPGARGVTAEDVRAGIQCRPFASSNPSGIRNGK